MGFNSAGIQSYGLHFTLATGPESLQGSTVDCNIQKKEGSKQIDRPCTGAKSEDFKSRFSDGKKHNPRMPEMLRIVHFEPFPVKQTIVRL